MAQAVSLRTVTTEAQHVLQVRLYGSCGVQGGCGTVPHFSLVSSIPLMLHFLSL